LYLFEKGLKAIIIWVKNCESRKIYGAVWRHFSCRNVSDLAEIIMGVQFIVKFRNYFQMNRVGSLVCITDHQDIDTSKAGEFFNGCRNSAYAPSSKKNTGHFCDGF